MNLITIVSKTNMVINASRFGKYLRRAGDKKWTMFLCYTNYNPNKFLNVLFICFCCLDATLPNSLLMSDVVTVINLCNRIVEETRKPVVVKSGSDELMTISESSWLSGTWLVIKANITCLCGPIESVRQTAGRIFAEERSSKGNGTKTILPFIVEWFSICISIDILFRVFQEIKSRIG